MCDVCGSTPCECGVVCDKCGCTPCECLEVMCNVCGKKRNVCDCEIEED